MKYFLECRFIALAIITLIIINSFLSLLDIKGEEEIHFLIFIISSLLAPAFAMLIEFLFIALKIRKEVQKEKTVNWRMRETCFMCGAIIGYVLGLLAFVFGDKDKIMFTIIVTVSSFILVKMFSWELKLESSKEFQYKIMSICTSIVCLALCIAIYLIPLEKNLFTELVTGFAATCLGLFVGYLLVHLEIYIDDKFGKELKEIESSREPADPVTHSV